MLLLCCKIQLLVAIQTCRCSPPLRVHIDYLPSMLVQKKLQQGCTGVDVCPSLSQSSPPPSIKLLQFIFPNILHLLSYSAAPERRFTRASLTVLSISKWQMSVQKSTREKEDTSEAGCVRRMKAWVKQADESFNGGGWQRSSMMRRREGHVVCCLRSATSRRPFDVRAQPLVQSREGTSRAIIIINDGSKWCQDTLHAWLH